MSFSLFLIWLFVVIGRPQDIFGFLDPARLALVLGVLTLIMTVLENRGLPLKTFLGPKENRRYLLFYLFMMLSIPLSRYRHASFDYTFLVYPSNLLLFYMLQSHACSVKRLEGILYTACVAAFFYVVCSLLKGTYISGRLDFGGMYDPNDLAFFLVSTFPIGLYFVRKAGISQRALALGLIVLSIAAIVMTGSRGGLLGLAVFSLFTFKRASRISFPVKVMVLLLLVALYAGYANRTNRARYDTLMNIGSDYNITSQFGRIAIWKLGGRLILSNPVTGVGVGCFEEGVGDLRAEMGKIPRWQAPHNSFLQVAAETGLIGFAFFISIIIACFRTFFAISAAGRGENTGNENKNPELADIASVLLIGFACLLVTAFFLTQAYSPLFVLYFALSPVVRDLADGADRAG